MRNIAYTSGMTNAAAMIIASGVNSAGQNVSGQIYLNNNCGSSSPNLSIFSVTITNVGGTTFTQTVNTDSNGNYNFTSVPNGTYTITPALTTSGPM